MSFAFLDDELTGLLYQGRWSWVRICAPDVWAMIKGYVDFAHPIFWTYFMDCAPNTIVLPLPLSII